MQTKQKTLFTRAALEKIYTDYMQVTYKKVDRPYHESLAAGYLRALPDAPAAITLSAALVKLLKNKDRHAAQNMLKAFQALQPEILKEYCDSSISQYGYEYFKETPAFASLRRRINAKDNQFALWRFEGEATKYNKGKKWLGVSAGTAGTAGIRAFNSKDSPAPSYSARDEINCGWYADAFQDNTYHAAAVLFRHGDKMLAHIGYYDVNAESYIVEAESPSIFEAKNFACQEDFLREIYGQASGITERAAERARDSDMQGHAEYMAEELQGENLDMLKQARELIQALKGARDLPGPICNVMREKLFSLRDDMRKNRKKAADGLENPYSLFY